MKYTLGDFIPMKAWGPDHWSTLAYVESRTVEGNALTVQLDQRMRSNRRTFRHLSMLGGNLYTSAVAMDINTGSQLADGSVVIGHDDWCCIQDMAAAGVADCSVYLDAGDTITLTEKGQQLASEVRNWLASGGSYGDFKPLTFEL